MKPSTMNVKLLAALALAAGGAIGTGAHAADFINGGFENNSASGWSTGEGPRYGSLNSSLSPARLLPGGDLYQGPATRSQLISAGTPDPIIGAALGSTVYAGSYAYRAEDTVSGGNASAISQQVLGYTAGNIFFTWKAVLENGGHPDDNSAALFITLRDDTTGTDLVSRFYNAGNGGGGVDSRFTAQDNFFYTPQWQLEQISIDPSRQGHDFTLSLLAADCQPAAHIGYAYLDGFGGVPPVPEPSTYAMLLAGLGMGGVLARRRKAGPRPG